ncbi:MAG: bifunctional nuclease family protein [Anaerolineaceae bacterium]|jgi:bifunctional DNase/RNase|nr:bifunctional nuclease family protein [Anaerolineaceae bacterium]
MSEMVEVVIDSVRVSLTNQQRIVLLRELEVERYLPIWIGPYEAESITISLQEIEIARPQTHDLLIETLEKTHARLTRVEVIALRGDIFYGNLVLESGGEIILIDARPSDSIALAVRAHVPILVARDILDTAGIIPEADIQQEIEDEESNQSAEEAGESKERLSVFESFLSNVKLDEEADKDKPLAPDDDPDHPSDDE